MPHSIFMGRVQEPGEPYFLREDSDLAIALAEEEQDTCRSCGYPKVWCRDPANQFKAFEAHEEQCHATFATAMQRESADASRDPAGREAVQRTAKFRDGFLPDLTAGLDLPGDE